MTSVTHAQRVPILCAGFVGDVASWQCCGSKYIKFESGSRILAQFGSGSMVLCFEF